MVSLADFDKDEAQAQAVRSRAQWIEHGESSSSFFLRLEKQHHAAKTIDVIQDPVSENLFSDPETLRTTWRDFYLNLFSSSSNDEELQEVLLDCIDTRLSKEEARLGEGLLSLEECYEALRGMAPNKTPGFDGLPSEFYLSFWGIIGRDLVEVLNFSFNSGSLSFSQRMGIITLLYKKGPRFLCKNWRPVTLLNVDYKIASRALALRLRKVIGSIVSPDQTCSVPGRFIGENIRLISDLVEDARENNKPLAILSLDQEKAFDRVDWSFLLRTLETFGFGRGFTQWVTLFYTRPLCSVMVNGFLSEPFSPSRGVRQGCPMSAPLYVLFSEVFACYLRSSLSLSGYRIHGPNPEHALTSGYADDLTVFCSSDDEIRNVFCLGKEYEEATGAKFNLEKSKGLWCGSFRGRPDKPQAITWTDEYLTCLGVAVGHGNLEHIIWDKRIENLRKIVTSWRQRALSYTGKAVVLNALALSGLWYVSSVVHTPDWVINEINKIIYPFFWTGKNDLVARDTLSLPKSHGGFGVVDVRQKSLALKAVWVRRFIEHPSAKWAAMFALSLNKAFGVSAVQALCDPAFYPHHLLPKFYAQVFEAWALLGGRKTAKEGFCFYSESGELSPITSHGAKSFYLALVMNPPSTPHCVVKFQSEFGTLYWKHTWKQLFYMPIDRKVIDTNWKIAHGVLYTADRLIGFGMNIDPRCFCQQADESASHLFYHCPFMMSLLFWAQSLFGKVTPLSPPLCLRHLLFSYDEQELQIVPPVFIYFLCLIKYFVWLARNDFRFNNKQPSSDWVKSSVIVRLNAHLKIFSKRFKSSHRKRFFHRAWNVLGKFSPDIRSISLS